MKILSVFSIFLKDKKAIFITAVCAVVSVITAATVIAVKFKTHKKEPEISTVSSEKTVSVEESVLSEPEPEPEPEPVSSESEPVLKETSKPAETPIKPKEQTPVIAEQKKSVGTDYIYNSNMSVDNNVFLDALVYTGYNIQAQRNSGLMWASGNNYVLCSRKRGLGWLSGITYGGGCTGYETDENGKPNISRFEMGGLVCASYATYVYFNYLPNVAGIDTSSLTRPERSYEANSWYIAANQWVSSGYSRYIDFTANDGGSVNRDISFSPAEDIPIGSIICLQDWYNRNGRCSHVSIYAGFAGGYHWVTHVGNANGPEFCAIERMNRKPDPQWPLKIITPPSNIRFSASVEVFVTDQNGDPMQGIGISLKNLSSGKVTDLRITDENGTVKGDGHPYGEHQVVQTIPTGYTCENDTVNINFTTGNNSMNTVKFLNTLILSEESEEENISDTEMNCNTDE